MAHRSQNMKRWRGKLLSSTKNDSNAKQKKQDPQRSTSCWVQQLYIVIRCYATQHHWQALSQEGCGKKSPLHLKCFKTRFRTLSTITFLLPSLKLTASSPLKIGHSKRKLVFQPSIFRCYVSFREGNCLLKYNSSWPTFRKAHRCWRKDGIAKNSIAHVLRSSISWDTLDLKKDHAIVFLMVFVGATLLRLDQSISHTTGQKELERVCKFRIRIIASKGTLQ